MRILILDDEPGRFARDDAVARVMAAHEVRCLPAGRDPLAVVRDAPSDVVVLGPSLADPSRGVPLVHAIRERYPGRRVIVLTDSGHPAGAVAFIKAGALDYVSPPGLAATLAGLAPAPATPAPPTPDPVRRPARAASPDDPDLVGTSGIVEQV